MACAYCGRRRRLQAAATGHVTAAPKVIVGQYGLAQVRYLGEGRGVIVGAETDHRYLFLPGELYAWVDKRDLAGFLELTLNDAALFEAVT